MIVAGLDRHQLLGGQLTYPFRGDPARDVDIACGPGTARRHVFVGMGSKAQVATGFGFEHRYRQVSYPPKIGQ